MRVGAVPAPTRYPPGHKETQIMRPRKQGKVYIANQSFVANIGGVDQAFHEGRTRAYEGDEVLKIAPNNFDELEDVDTAQSYE